MFKVDDKVMYAYHGREYISWIRELRGEGANQEAQVVGLFTWLPISIFMHYGKEQQREVSVRVIHGADEGEVCGNVWEAQSR